MQISELEIFRATVAHKKHPGCLFYANFSDAIAKSLRERLNLSSQDDLRDYFGMYYAIQVQPREPALNSKPDFSRYYNDIDCPENSFINELGVLEIPSGMYHLTGYISPLRNATDFSELRDFPFLPVDGFDGNHMSDEVRKIHDKGKVAVTIIGHMYESAWQIRGYQEFLLDMMVQPEWCEFILDTLQERNRNLAELAADSGVDYIMVGDDVANQRNLMFSIEYWRRFMKHRWAEVFAAAKRIKPDIKAWYHSDGNIMNIIPELIEIGVDILNPIQPECLDPLIVKKRFGDKLVLDGTIGTQTTLPFGTPDEVCRVMRERVSTLLADGALILAPTHLIEPDVPLENILAFCEAAKSV